MCPSSILCTAERSAAAATPRARAAMAPSWAMPGTGGGPGARHCRHHRATAPPPPGGDAGAGMRRGRPRVRDHPGGIRGSPDEKCYMSEGTAGFIPLHPLARAGSRISTFPTGDAELERALRVTQRSCRPCAHTQKFHRVYRSLSKSSGELTPNIQPQFPALSIIFINHQLYFSSLTFPPHGPPCSLAGPCLGDRRKWDWPQNQNNPALSS